MTLNAIISNVKRKITSKSNFDEIKKEIRDELIEKRGAYPKLTDKINKLVERIDLSKSKTDLEIILETNTEKIARVARENNLAKNK